MMEEAGLEFELRRETIFDGGICRPFEQRRIGDWLVEVDREATGARVS